MNTHIDAIVEYVTHTTGLALSPAQVRDLEHYVGRRTSGEVIAGLGESSEFRKLIDLLTVQETFFFRYQAQFDAFHDRLPRLLERAHHEGRRVRVWSAGCCTGEEAYTLALIAAERGCLDRVEIIATDINESYLEAAMRGTFSRRSIANVPASMLQSYFTTSSDRFVIDDRLRAHVGFKWLNLAESTYPSFLNGTAGLDLIFCRNVLIYFDKTRIKDIVERLGACLCDDGVLALGHSEMLPREWALTVHQIGEAFFYSHQPAAKPVIPAAEPIVMAPPRASRPVLVAPPKNPGALLDEAERLANHGHTPDAAQRCRDAIALDASLERGHYLLGLLSLDTPAEALEHFRRAVRLDPAHLPARLHLAECAEKTGQRVEAVLEYRALERLARARPPEDILDPLEGITYGMLALIGESARRRLE